MQDRCCLLVAVSCLLGVAMTASAEVKVRRLPDGCVDVAIDPDTGNLLALVGSENIAQFHRAAAWRQGGMEPAGRIAVGKAPAAVVFKRFRTSRFFAVVCEQDAHVYLINADDGSLIKKIPLGAGGAGNVVSSTNPDDPFVYYVPVARLEEYVGAVSLQTMQDLGSVLGKTRDCAVSASGQVAYIRSPGISPSGFESLLRTNGPTADKPAFAPLFRDHADSERYVPDPFDRYTATGNRIYTRGLEKEVASVDFTPLCWFRTRPLVVGITADRPQRSGAAEASRVVLRAASTNNFRPAGGFVAIDIGPAAKPGAASPAPVPADAKPDRVRMFALDADGCVLYARRSLLAVVPLADFRVPDEPFLTATLTGGDSLLVGREAVLKVGPADPRVRLRIEWLPDGMQASGNELRWKPTVEQIGPTKLVVSLAHGDLERTQTFELAVRRPSVLLPFEPVGCAVTEDGRTAFVWDGLPDGTQRQRLPRPADPGFWRMAAIDLVTAAVRAEKRTPDPVQRAIAAQGLVFLFAPDSERCDVHDLATLERVRTLVASAPIREVESGAAGIILRTQSGLEVFDATTFERKQRHARESVPPGHAPWAEPSRPVQPPLPTARGIVADGVLFAADGKPVLLLSPPWLPAVFEEPLRAVPAFLRTAMLGESLMNQSAQNNTLMHGDRQLASVGIPRTAGRVSIALRPRSRSLQDTTRSWRQDYDVWLIASGDRPLQEVLDRQAEVPRELGDEGSFRAAVCVIADDVYATVGNRLYKVPWPQAIGDARKAPLLLTPRQSALVVPPDGPATLRHETEGGRQPLRFVLVRPAPGLSIDEATGTVTIDRTLLLEEAARRVEKLVVKRGVAGSYADACRQAAESLGGRVAEITGERPAGFPVLVPIGILATDAAGMQDTLHYHVIAGVPDSLIMPRLRRLDGDHIRSQVASSPEPPAPPSPALPDRRSLARRVDLLEQQLDLITRQLNEVMNRLGE